MEMLEEAGFADAVRTGPGFQLKNGAAFSWGSRYTEFDFTDKFSDGPGTVYQVRRAVFDKILIEEAAKQGVEVRFGHGVTAFDNSGDFARLNIETDTGESYELTAKFVLDASGYGRVLPRLLNLETPSHLPPRQTHFTHIDDNITHPKFDRNKILITTHPQQPRRVDLADSLRRQPLFRRRGRHTRQTCRRIGNGVEKICLRMPDVERNFGQSRLRKRFSVPLHPRLFRQRQITARQAFRAVGQCRRVPRPRVLVGRNHRAALRQTCCRSADKTTQRRSRRLANRICRTPDDRRRRVPHLCGRLV